MPPQTQAAQFEPTYVHNVLIALVFDSNLFLSYQHDISLGESRGLVTGM